MKSIEQLLQLKLNPYYKFTTEENEALEYFLAKQSAKEKPQGKRSTNSSEKTPAIVHNKNRFDKETGEVPTINAL